MSEIRYRINSITSEHPRYPAQNLLQTTDGWESAYNCSYPQSITLQFFVPIKTKKLHLLFHQYKIPKLVEIFVRLGRQKYRKLGYLIPNDNSQSSYEEKQQKILYFQFWCTHIRLVIHQNYKNEMNVFNQIAIEDINVIGEILNHQDIAGIDLTEEDSSDDEVSESVEISHNLRSIGEGANIPLQNNSNESSPLFQDIYAKLQHEKQIAVSKEDYQKAAYFKTILSNFKNLENDIIRLEKEKQQALANEDYDRCHNIKHLIQKKKEVAEYQREELYRNEDQFLSHNSFSRVIKATQNDTLPLQESKRKDYYSNQSMAKLKSPQIDKQVVNSSNLYDNQIVPALVNKGKLSEFNLLLETNEKRKETFFDANLNQSMIPELLSDNDLSSVKKDTSEVKQSTDRNNDVSVAAESLKLEPLENKLRLTVENYFDFIPEKIWQLSEHKSWKGKLQAVKFLKERVDSIETKQHFMGTLSLISRIIVSKQAVISIEVLQILNKMTDIKLKFTLQSLPFFIEDIIGELLNFLNDTNNKIKELAYTTYKKLPEISFLNISVPIRELIRHKNKVKNDPKLIITKLHLMGAIIEKYPQFQYHCREIANWLFVYMEDPNQQVRKEAVELLVTISFLVGNDKVIKLFGDNKPHLLEVFLTMLNNSINSFDNSKVNPADNSKHFVNNSKLQQEFYGGEIGKFVKQSNKNAAEKPMYILETEDKRESSKSSRRQIDSKDIDLSYSKESIYEQSAQRLQQSQKPSQGESIKLLSEPGVCQYCQQPFQNEKLHYIYHCKVLAYCDRCMGVIYLREFTNHLLNECEESHQFKQCKRCGLAFELDEINEHIGKDMCKKKPGLNWQRCQFCGADVMGEDRFWLQHAKNCNSLPQKNMRRLEEASQIEESFQK